MGRLQPGVFAEAFLRWAQSALPDLGDEQICLDGKTLRGSRLNGKAVHLLTAYAAKARLVLALKDNHPQLCEDVSLWQDTETNKGALNIHETIDKDHGRIEIRRYTLSTNIGWLEQKSEWVGLQAVGRVESIRIIGDKTSTEYRYYLTSLIDLQRFGQSVRQHWAIENSQHWVLDVQFNKDSNRSRKDHSPENLALVRRMALNVIRHNGSSKQSIRTRKLKACLNDDYRFELIFGKEAT